MTDQASNAEVESPNTTTQTNETDETDLYSYVPKRTAFEVTLSIIPGLRLDDPVYANIIQQVQDVFNDAIVEVVRRTQETLPDGCHIRLDHASVANVLAEYQVR